MQSASPGGDIHGCTYIYIYTFFLFVFAVALCIHIWGHRGASWGHLGLGLALVAVGVLVGVVICVIDTHHLSRKH